MKTLLFLTVLLFGFPALAAPTITASGTNSSITVTVSGGPGNPKDWVGISTKAGKFLSSLYLNGQGVAPNKGLTAATVVFPGQPNGDYVATFYLNNGSTVLASAPFTIGAVAPGISGIECTGMATCQTTNGKVVLDVPSHPWPAFINPTLGSPCNRDDTGFNFTEDMANIFLCKDGGWVKIGPMPITGK